ncbi:hypothetical protein [Agromyces salentinus]|uniref:Lipoprotein n=1 Tax=Agromyces salentinus TaxID=269421 RepID=A0ABP4ZD19_9MICO|nr:hypothetical protein [Agromyces salentinus]
MNVRPVTGAVCLIGLFALTGCVSQPAPASEHETKIAVTDVIDGAGTAFGDGDFEAFCREQAADVPMCLSDSQSWLDAKSAPPSISSVSFTIAPFTDDSLLVRFEGILYDGSAFSSETEALRTSDGAVRLVHPVFWVPRTMIAG